MSPDRSLILEEAERWLFRLILLVSVFLMVRGHNAPGGGFIGGLVAGAAFTLRHLAGRAGEADLCGRARPHVLLGAGVLLAVGTAMAPLVSGDALLESAVFAGDWPVVGTFKLVSAAVFDFGVYLAVIGFVLTVLVVLGEPLDDGSGGGERP
jgi:multicomponent Na+:H+ antiporter subunit A